MAAVRLSNVARGWPLPSPPLAGQQRAPTTRKKKRKLSRGRSSQAETMTTTAKRVRLTKLSVLLLLLLLLFLASARPTATTTKIATTSLPQQRIKQPVQERAVNAGLQHKLQTRSTIYSNSIHEEFVAGGYSQATSSQQQSAAAAGSGAPNSRSGAEQPGRQLAIQLALVSARGALAFWRPVELSQQQQQLKGGSPGNQAGGGRQTSGQHQQLLQSAQLKCPQLDGQLGAEFQPGLGATSAGSMAGGQQPTASSHLPKSLSSSASPSALAISPEPQQQASASAQVVGVEGTSIKLNFVILGHRFAASGAQQRAATKLRLSWTKDGGQQVIVNAPRGGRFKQQLINENDLLRQYQTSGHSQQSAAPPSSLMTSQQQQFLSNPDSAISSFGHSHRQQQQQRNLSATSHYQVPSDESSFTGHGQADDAGAEFMLAPHLNERMASRLSSSSLRLVDSKLIASKRHQSLNLVDDFLGDGQSSIDWQKLEAYLKFNAGNFRIYLPPGGGTAADPAATSAGVPVTLGSGSEPAAASQPSTMVAPDLAANKLPECAALSPQIEQLTILQLEINHLTLQDQGQYQLQVCTAMSNEHPQQQVAGGELADQLDQLDLQQLQLHKLQRCRQSISFELHVAEDVPHLESKPEHRVLEVGERLSIKCEATGFTLPQITWFLDGQQLNEHQQPLVSFFGGSPSAGSGDDDGDDHHLMQTSNSMSSSSSRGGANSLRSSNTIIANPTRLRIGDYVSPHDNHVHSFVNSSHVQVSDGGFYKCQANNGFHLTEHEIRLDVRGPPTIGRRLANMSVLIGQGQLHIQCPYSGFPVESIEWFYRPSSSSTVNRLSSQPADYSQLGARLRAKRGPTAEDNYSTKLLRLSQQPAVAAASGGSSGLVALDSSSPPERELDPDKDEWLSQASAMTPAPNAEDYPDSLPDYPAPNSSGAGPAYDDTALDAAAAYLQYGEPFPALDYSDIGTDFQQQPEGDLLVEQQRRRRRKRDAQQQQQQPAMDQVWVKFPQSRRHQVHQNGTLIIQDVGRSDQGFYKCRVLASNFAADQALGAREPTSDFQRQPSVASTTVATSNEFLLTVSVPPVISPFASADSLREGMRNFLTCSVIEGDSPVKLRWLKDGQPIEDYIQRQALLQPDSHSSQPASSAGHSFVQAGGQPQQAHQQARIRVETSNEYTSTLYFSHVDFRDNGNYTCIAANKAASVNYTAKMLVNVPPKWIKAPKDLECVAGQNVVIDCQAQAHPNPRVWWEIGVYAAPDAPDSANKDSLATAGSTANGGSNSAKSQHKPPAGSFSDSEVAPPTVLGQNHHHHTHNQMQQKQIQLQHPPNHYRTIISNSRIHILENASLVIRDASRLDQGYYLCQAANNFGSLSSLIKLTVNVGASFPSKYLMKYVKLNEKIELDCDPIGQSPVDVTWFMQQHPAAAAASYNNNIAAGQQSNRTLFSAIHLHSSPARQQQLQENQLADRPPPPMTTTTTTTAGQQQRAGPESLGRRLFMGTIRTELQQHVSSGSAKQDAASAYLAATGGQEQMQQSPISGDSSPSSSSVIDLDSSLSFELVRRPDGLSELVRLRVKQARRVHSAEFICQASNRYGSDEKLIKLLVQEPPDPVQEIGLVQVDSRSASLSWQAPYNGNSPITSYTVEWALLVPPTGGSSGTGGSDDGAGNGNHLYVDSEGGRPEAVAAGSAGGSARPAPANRLWNQVTSQQAAASLRGLQPMTTYEVRIRAHNQLGESAWPVAGTGLQQPVVFTTTEEAPSAPPSDIRVSPLSSSSLQLSWLPPIGQQTTSGLQQHSGRPSTLSADLLAYGDLAAAAEANSRLPAGSSRFSVKGYYLGYKVTNSNESFVFKTVSLNEAGYAASEGTSGGGHPPATSELQAGAHQQNRTSSSAGGLLNATATSAPDSSRRLRVLIGDLKRSTKYTIIVQAFNSAGPGPQSDPIEAKTLISDPPPAPMLRVGTITYTSVELEWSFQFGEAATFQQHSSIAALLSDEQPRNHHSHQQQLLAVSDSTSSSVPGPIVVDGYHLYYRPTEGQWLERRLSPETHAILATSHQRNELSIVERANGGGNGASSLESRQAPQSDSTSSLRLNQWHRNITGTIVGSSQQQLQLQQQQQFAFKSFRFTLDQLSCGNAYQLYLVAYNSIGSGQPSQVIRAKMRGSAPIAPRKQDYISVNSTYVQLNFDAWMDGGCSIGNFEIRYKQLNGGASNGFSRTAQVTQTPISHSKQASSAGDSSAIAVSQQWLLLSNNVSPEQRMIELRDLQPETWYSVLTSAESAAGKTEVQYTFMTLDKFGQLPAEAMEQPGTNSLPALFRSNGSLRSILSSFSSNSNSGDLVSPLVIVGCMCLILFATCSLFLIRRYNGLMKDSVSVDSQTTSGGGLGSASSHYHHHHHAGSLHYGSPKLISSGNLIGVGSSMGAASIARSAGGNGNIGGDHYAASQQSVAEYYSMKVSPCKTTATNSSSGPPTSVSDQNQLDSGISVGIGGGGGQDQSIDLSQFINSSPATAVPDTNVSDHVLCAAHPQFNSATLANPHHHQPEPHHHHQQQQRELSTEFDSNNTGCGGQICGESSPLSPSIFKTMPHRPVSTFIPNGTYHPTRFLCNGNQQQQHKLQQQTVQNDYQQQQLTDQQQIYSKLRLIYNTSNYNLRSDGQNYQQQQLVNSNNEAGNYGQFQQQSIANPGQTLGTEGANQQQQAAPNGLQPANEQNDYAQPFPPKWV